MKQEKFWETVHFLSKKSPEAKLFTSKVIEKLESSLSGNRQKRKVSTMDLGQLAFLCAGSDRKSTQPALTIISTAWILFYFAANLMDKVADGDLISGKSDRSEINSAVQIASGAYFLAGRCLNLLSGIAGLEKKVLFRIVDRFYEYFLLMGSGQFLENEKRVISMEEYRVVASLKSGKFFRLACESGADAAARSEETVAMLGEFGELLGVLIQVLDDLEDFSELKQISQPMHQLNLVHSLPIVYALEVLPEQESGSLLALLDEPGSQENNEKVLSILDECGAGIFLLAQIQSYENRMYEILGRLPESFSTAGDLKRMVDQLVGFV
jgi:geranylgeranyl pyrophosphate synthase